jgi:hypothetical protein
MHRLIGDVPGLGLPMELLLFGECDTAPGWDRIFTAERRHLQLTLRDELKNRPHVSTLVRKFVHVLCLKWP